jgi:hypothetical protein
MSTQTTPPEPKLHTVDGVQVFARKDDDGTLQQVDAIDTDEARIRDIADRLQRRGFGVQRRRSPRAGRVYYTLKAFWTGDGPPPDDPFDSPG